MTLSNLFVILIPKSTSNLDIILVSAKSGTLESVNSVLYIKDDAIKGNAAFLAPLILICPLRGCSPVI